MLADRQTVLRMEARLAFGCDLLHRLVAPRLAMT